jgi:hypothetical protein
VEEGKGEGKRGGKERKKERKALVLTEYDLLQLHFLTHILPIRQQPVLNFIPPCTKGCTHFAHSTYVQTIHIILPTEKWRIKNHNNYCISGS